MRTVLYVLPLVLLTAVGCFPMLATVKEPPPKAVPQQPPRLVPAVTADEVTPENAHQKAQALREELEQAQRDLPTGPLAGPEAPRR